MKHHLRKADRKRAGGARFASFISGRSARKWGHKSTMKGGGALGRQRDSGRDQEIEDKS